MFNRRQFLAAMSAAAGAAMLGGRAFGSADDNRLHVGVLFPSATHGWAGGVGWWAEQEMKKFPNVRWEFQRAGTAAEQAGQIDALVQKGIASLAILPMDSDTPMRPLRKAKEQGVYLVVVDRALREPIADLYIAGDNKAFGREAAEFMVKKLGGKGNVVVLRGLPVEIDAERFDAFKAVVDRNAGVKILGSQPGNWNRQDAHTVMQAFLTKFPQIDAVWASDDDMALGVDQAIREAGRSNQMWVLGGAGMKQIVKKVMDGDATFPADITYPPGMIAAGVALAVAGAGNGNEAGLYDQIPADLKIDKSKLQKAAPAEGAKTPQRTLRVDVQLVTPDNARQFYFPDSVY